MQNSPVKERVFPKEAKIFSFTEVFIGFGKMSDKTPYFLGILDGEDSEKILCLLEGSKPEIGLPVQFKCIDEEGRPVYAVL